jgi:hypothetical protein
VWDETSRPTSSTLAYPEGRAALALARRLERLTDGYPTTVTSFETVFESLEAIDPGRQTVLRAGELAEQHALRGYDAVHLASALDALGEGDVLVTWDDVLAGAGREAGLTIVGSLGAS